MDGESRRLLIVEDELSTLFALRAMFRRRGWDVAIARSVAEALRQLDPAPDWIILDLGLPDGDGELVLRHVRSLGLESSIAVTSGFPESDHSLAMSGLGPEVIMRKPIDFDRLYDTCVGATPATPEWQPLGAR